MKEKRKKTGLAPGSVVFTGDRKVEKIHIHFLKYNETTLEEAELNNQEEIVFQPSDTSSVHWYDVRGLHDTKLLETLGKTFNIHPLFMEDVADIHQRPKFEEYEKGIALFFKALRFDETQQTIETEQVAVYFRPGLVLSFQETESDLLEKVRNRIRMSNGRIRLRGADYLGYALMDTIIDQYYPILDAFEAHIETMEEELLDNPDEEIKENIHYLKKELLASRKVIYPLREAISRFAKAENAFIADKSRALVRDLYDNTIQIIDTLDGYRDTLNGLQDLYMSEIYYKMNAVMKVLTMITTIFVPLSFLAGLYGMNFAHMPELQWKFGYFGLLAIMGLIVLLLLRYFRNRKWF